MALQLSPLLQPLEWARFGASSEANQFVHGPRFQASVSTLGLQSWGHAVGMASETSDKRLVTLEEGEAFYRLANIYYWFPFCVLFPISIVWAALPANIFASGVAQSVDTWIRETFHKFASDGSTIDALSNGLAAKYIIFTAVCWLIIILTQVLFLVPVTVAAWRTCHPVKRRDRGLYWSGPIMFALTFYYQRDIPSRLVDPTPGHLTRLWVQSWLLYPTMAMTWCFFHLMFAFLILMIVKIARHRKL